MRQERARDEVEEVEGMDATALLLPGQEENSNSGMVRSNTTTAQTMQVEGASNEAAAAADEEEKVVAYPGMFVVAHLCLNEDGTSACASVGVTACIKKGIIFV
jgi:hypothetical protein